MVSITHLCPNILFLSLILLHLMVFRIDFYIKYVLKNCFDTISGLLFKNFSIGLQENQSVKPFARCKTPSNQNQGSKSLGLSSFKKRLNIYLWVNSSTINKIKCEGHQINWFESLWANICTKCPKNVLNSKKSLISLLSLFKQTFILNKKGLKNWRTRDLKHCFSLWWVYNESDCNDQAQM